MADNSKIAGWTLAGAFAGLLAWLLFSKKGKAFLHEKVTTILVPSQAVTGIPQFDYNLTSPNGVPVPPVTDVSDVNHGVPSYNPSRPELATCPAGYILWHETATNVYMCYPGGDARLGVDGQ